MADSQRPQTWIGSEVMVARASATEAELVLLKNLTQRGVVCIYQVSEGGEPVLIPWDSVSWLRPATPEEAHALKGDSQRSS